VFLLSYFFPLSLLILFKRIKIISNFDIRTTSERKIPLAILIIILNQYFNADLFLFIAFFIFLIGLLATARLIVKAHTPIELLAGFIFGSGSIIIITQLII